MTASPKPETSPPPPCIFAACFGEVLGTFMLILFGCGAVHAAVLTGAQSGVWQVAVVWGLAIMLAIFVTGGVSGAHLNPAMTVAFALYGKFSWSRVPVYIVAQLAGAILAAGVLFFLYGPQLDAKEKEKQVVRGMPGSEITAMCYGEYFPNPGSLAGGTQTYSTAEHDKLRTFVTLPIALVAETLGTLILALVVFAVTDNKNPSAPQAGLAPVFIGLTVSALISVIAPLTQAGFNPARDFGPRLFSYFAGWGTVAIPWGTDWSWLTVYILAPLVGAILGGGVYQKLIRPGLK